MTITVGWITEHYAHGWFMDDDCTVHQEYDPEIVALHGPVEYEDGHPHAPPLRRLLDHGIPTFICRTCGEPSWSLRRHAAERHGVDVEVPPPFPGKVRPEWMQADWI